MKPPSPPAVSPPMHGISFTKMYGGSRDVTRLAVILANHRHFQIPRSPSATHRIDVHGRVCKARQSTRTERLGQPRAVSRSIVELERTFEHTRMSHSQIQCTGKISIVVVEFLSQS